VLRLIADTLAGVIGEAARGLFAEAAYDPTLMRSLHTRLIAPGEPPMLEVLRRGLVRGEVRPTTLTHRVVRLGPDLLASRFFTLGTPITDHELAEIVDEVIIPLVGAHINRA
jgi:hypothetical protein